MENKVKRFLTDEEISGYYLLLEEKKTFEERQNIILSILDNPEIGVDKRLGKMLKSYKEDITKIHEQNSAEIDEYLKNPIEDNYDAQVKTITDAMNTYDKDSIYYKQLESVLQILVESRENSLKS
jgi:beta-mannanase